MIHPFSPSSMQPSLLALAVLGCDLKLLGCDWLTAVVTLQKLAGVRGGELSVCYETVAPFYNVIAMHHPLYISSKPPASGGEGVGGTEEGGSQESDVVAESSEDCSEGASPPGDVSGSDKENASKEEELGVDEAIKLSNTVEPVDY